MLDASWIDEVLDDEARMTEHHTDEEIAEIRFLEHVDELVSYHRGRVVDISRDDAETWAFFEGECFSTDHVHAARRRIREGS
jgi:hypothetical protein